MTKLKSDKNSAQQACHLVSYFVMIKYSKLL